MDNLFISVALSGMNGNTHRTNFLGAIKSNNNLNNSKITKKIGSFNINHSGSSKNTFNPPNNPAIKYRSNNPYEVYTT